MDEPKGVDIEHKHIENNEVSFFHFEPTVF